MPTDWRRERSERGRSRHSCSGCLNSVKARTGKPNTDWNCCHQDHTRVLVEQSKISHPVNSSAHHTKLQSASHPVGEREAGTRSLQGQISRKCRIVQGWTEAGNFRSLVLAGKSCGFAPRARTIRSFLQFGGIVWVAVHERIGSWRGGQREPIRPTRQETDALLRFKE